MPSWSELLEEIKATGSTHDYIRRKYLQKLHEVVGRNIVVYYSGWLQKGHLGPRGVRFEVNDSDKNGFMTAVHKFDKTRGLDIFLHTPGGSTAATESLVDYLRSIFGTDIRAIVPQLALSAGTMIALACKEIVMGKQSSLGPIDPQVAGLAAHGVVEEFKQARSEINANPQGGGALWAQILHKYGPTLVGECKKAIDWSEQMAKDWLMTGMFAGDAERTKKAKQVVDELGNHALTLSHDRHISMSRAKEIGLTIVPMEADPKLQDAVLSVHHACILTLSETGAFKIIENHLGHAFIQVINQTVLVQQ